MEKGHGIVRKVFERGVEIYQGVVRHSQRVFHLAAFVIYPRQPWTQFQHLVVILKRFQCVSFSAVRLGPDVVGKGVSWGVYYKGRYVLNGLVVALRVRMEDTPFH